VTVTVAGDALPASARGLDANQLLLLDRPAAAVLVAGALTELYLQASGQDDGLDDSGEQWEVDHHAPLFLESLVAARLNAVLEAWLGVTVPLAMLLQEAPTIAALSEQLVDELHARAGQPTGPAQPELAADPESHHLEFPLAEIQQAYWIGRDPVYELGNVAAHLYVELRVIDFDVPRAELALRRMIARHDMLRSFVTRSGQQRVMPQVPEYRIEVMDLSGADPSRVDDVLAAERDRMLRLQLSADDWRPFEVRVTRLPDRRSQLALLFNMVKLDAWSAQLFIAEWFALCDDPGRELPDIGLSFRDYVVWTKELESTESFERSRRYWLDRVPELPPAPELPLVKPLGSVRQPRFGSRSAKLDAPTWSALKARAERNGLSPSIVLCAAYAEVLGAWSRRQRFTLSVAGGRPVAHPEIARVIGPFARPMLLAVDGTVPGGFAARAQAVARRFAADFEHRDFGGLEVLRELARTRGLTRAAMPVIFTSVLPQGGDGGLQRPAWHDEHRYVVWGMPQLLLENQVLDLDGELIITWVAVDELFPDGLVDEMFGAYQRLLGRLAASDGAWTAPEPRLLPAAQLARRAAANDTAAPMPEGLLHSGFSRQVALRPNEPAVISGRRTLSYAELDRHAGYVADQLAGVRRGSLVAVCMEKGWEQVAAVLGVLRAGAGYLPLDPELPTERLHQLLASGEVRQVLTQPSVDECVCWPDGVRRVLVDEDAVAGGAAAVDAAAGAAVGQGDLAYVIFTSGSTGVPKGVMIDHLGALNTIADVNRRFGIGPEDRVLALSALSFDLSVYDIFGPLAVGGAVVMPDAAAAKDPAHLAELIRRERVTVWNSVPALMEMLVEHGRVDPGALRLAMLSGDWIPTDLPDRIWRAFPGAEVVSLGGATEASIWSITYPIAESQRGRRSVPYGHPMDNQRFHVLNQRMEPCPELVPGELYIAGVGLAKGYWRDGERTAAGFVTHPASGETLYRTGDFGRYLRDGEIEFLGREDSQVKVNGYRIELGEIEAALEEHPAVRSAVAVARGEREGSKWLVAFVVGEALPDEATLRTHAADRLPEYAVPVRIVELPGLPLTANGKVDRAALPGLEELAAADGEYAAPDTELEARLAGLWAEALEQPRVGVHDNFFAMGGTSLRAVQLATIAQDAGLWLAAADVLRNQTVRELAAAVHGRTGLPAPDELACAAVVEPGGAGPVEPGRAAVAEPCGAAAAGAGAAAVAEPGAAAVVGAGGATPGEPG